MTVTIIAVGKLKEKYLKEGINEYKKKLSGYCKLDIIEINDEPAPENSSPAEENIVKEKEALNILRQIREGVLVVVLDVKGKKMSSEELATKLNNWMVSGRSDIAFIIGGSLGIGERVLKRADLRLSLSDMTFPHQLTRLILLDQIYRVFRIMHKEM